MCRLYSLKVWDWAIADCSNFYFEKHQSDWHNIVLRWIIWYKLTKFWIEEMKVRPFTLKILKVRRERRVLDNLLNSRIHRNLKYLRLVYINFFLNIIIQGLRVHDLLNSRIHRNLKYLRLVYITFFFLILLFKDWGCMTYFEIKNWSVDSTCWPQQR